MVDAVVIRDLHKAYGAVAAVRGVSLTIHEGETFGLLGPNGAGKTTTLECLLGLREPDRGDIEVCGIDARRSPATVKQEIGAAMQTTLLQDKITPREALGLFGAFYRRRQEPQALIDRFGLHDKADAPFDSLSGGQRQRLALALAFVNDPKIVVLDEPTAGLDPHARRDLQEMLGGIRRRGQTILVTTHDLHEAAQLCDRIAIIDRGEIIALGAPDELTAASAGAPGVTVTASGRIPATCVRDLPGATEVAVDGPTLHFSTTSVNQTLAALIAALDREGLAVVELHVQKSTLEDVFLELTRATTNDGGAAG